MPNILDINANDYAALADATAISTIAHFVQDAAVALPEKETRVEGVTISFSASSRLIGNIDWSAYDNFEIFA